MMPDQVDTLEWWEERELRELDGDEGASACWSVGSTAAIRARRTASATFATTIQPILRVRHRTTFRDDWLGLAPHMCAAPLSGSPLQAHSGVFTQAVTDEQWRRAFTIMTTRYNCLASSSSSSSTYKLT